MNQHNSEVPDLGRQVISIRAQPALKNHLTMESIGLGITLSQHCENIISTRNETQKKLEELLKSNIEKDRQIEKLTKEAIAMQQKQLPAIFQDERLLFLFNKLKDKSDNVDNAYGENFPIIYSNTEDVLKAIIYSIKLKD